MGQGSSLIDYDPQDAEEDEELELNPMTYPNFGNYTMQNVPLKELAFRSQQEQMKFSDAITRRYALNPLFLRMQQAEFAKYNMTMLLTHANETSIGNMAFMAHWNPEGFWQEKYDEMLRILRA